MEFLSIILAAVFINNVVLTQIFGSNAINTKSVNLQSTVKFGLSMTFLMTLAVILTKLVNETLLVNLQYMKILVYALIVGLLVEVYSIFFKKDDINDKSRLLIGANALLLGIALTATPSADYIGSVILYPIGAGLGFTLVSLIVDSVNYKYRHAQMPKNYLNNPITFIALGLIALAFYGFNGLF